MKPNIDKLLSNSFYFKQTISSSDSTGNSLGSIFSGLYPFRSNINFFNFNKVIRLLTENLKENHYSLFSVVPDLSFFKKLTTNFDKNISYVYDKRASWLQLQGGIGEQIIQHLKYAHRHEPWFMFVHLMDLHGPFFIPNGFDKLDYGINRYARMLSYIDTWIGKILSQLNFENTLLVITSDHGEYVPIIDNEISYNTTKRRLIRKIKKYFPIMDPLTHNIYGKYLKFKRDLAIKRLQKTFSPDQMRTFNQRADETLFDETLIIPLLFFGFGISGKKEISNQVRQIDILPTILDFANIRINHKIDGRSLKPFLNMTLNDLPTIIENGSKDPKKLGSLIGIRTSKHKYLRSRDSSSKNVILYDLENDMLEKKNLASSNPEIIKNMEKILNEYMSENSKIQTNALDESELQNIEQELKKLGYL